MSSDDHQKSKFIANFLADNKKKKFYTVVAVIADSNGKKKLC